MANQFDALLRGLSLKVTPKRVAILEILAAEPIYLAPEEVWKRMKRKSTRAGLPTVYRNLEELSACGILIKIVHPDRRLYYYFFVQMTAITITLSVSRAVGWRTSTSAGWMSLTRK